MEVEFVASASAVEEAIWLKFFLQHLRIVTITHEVVTIYCDNRATIAYTKDPKYHGKPNILISSTIISRIISQKEIVLQYINIHQMKSDLLIKSIGLDVDNSHV